MMAAPRDDLRFYGRLMLVFGPLFILGGWLAAFTDVGAWMIFAGAAMLLASVALLRTRQSVALAAAALLIGLGWPFLLSAV